MRRILTSFLVGALIGLFIFNFLLKDRILAAEMVLGNSSEQQNEETVVTATPTATSTHTPTPTSTPTETPTPTSSPTPTVTPTLTLSPTPSLSPSPTQTPTPTLTPAPLTAPADQDHFYNQYAGQYNVDSQLLRRIAFCESRFNPVAVNGPYLGLFQFNADVWQRYRIEMRHDINPDLRADMEQAIKTAAYAISLGKLHLWPNCSK